MSVIAIKCANCDYTSGNHDTLTEAIDKVENDGGKFPLNSTHWTSCPKCFLVKKLYLSSWDGKVQISEVLIENLLRINEVMEVITVNAGKQLAAWMARQKCITIGKEMFITREQYEVLKGIA